MAKQYIVNTTIQTRDKGKKVVIPRSPLPRDVPAGLVKELLANGAITDVEAGVDAGDTGSGGSDDGTSGD